MLHISGHFYHIRPSRKHTLDVNNVGGGALVSSRTGTLLLIELVVEKQVLVVVAERPALVSVGSTVVGGAGELAGHGATADVNDGEGILVIVEADLLVLVGGHGTFVDDALSIMDVAVRGDAASILGAARVGYINHPEAATALEVDGSADGGDEVRLLIGNNVVAGAEAGEVGSKVTARRPGGRVGRVGGAELSQVEDLKTVISGLGADVGEVADDLDVAPDGGDGLGGEATDVDQAAIRLDLNEGSAVRLAQETVLLTSIGISPA